MAPAVKVAALEAGLTVLQPTRPVGDLFLASLRRLEADLGVVVAYGHILRREVLDTPSLGMINVHASLLPRFRGAAPIQHAILAGDRETGISIMKMEEGLDSGPVLHRVSTPIADGETAGTLTARLAALGATALVEALSLLSAGAAAPQPQDSAAATHAPKISRETARLDWTRDAASLERQVRALDPVPGAWTSLRGSAGQALRRHARRGRRGARQRHRRVRPPGRRGRHRRDRGERGAARRAESPDGRGMGPRPRDRRREAIRVRPLPRLHAVTDAAVLAAPDFAARAAAIAAAGPAVALHARDRSSGGASLARVALRLVALAGPPEASVFVNARSDVARGHGSAGSAAGRYRPPAGRRPGLVPARAGSAARSIRHRRRRRPRERERTFCMVGNVYPTDSHPGRPAGGLALVRDSVRLGLPVIAIGGIDASRAGAVRDEGAYGIAAIAALWRAADPAAAALALLAPWTETA